MSAVVTVPNESLLLQELLRFHGACKLVELIIVQIFGEEVVFQQRQNLAHLLVRFLVIGNLVEVKYG